VELNPDLAKEILKPPRRHAALWSVLLASSAAASVWVGSDVYRQYQNLQHQKQLVVAMQRAPKSQPHAPAPVDIERRRSWNELRRELNFSWYPMFAALEHTSSPDVALLEFIPDKVARRLTLRGTARDMNALTAYITALAEEQYFFNVFLSHQKKTVKNNAEVIDFEVKMQIRE
jgi:hypothetical protein